MTKIKKENVTISLTKEQKEIAKTKSKEVFGSVNVSAYYGYLLEKENKNIVTVPGIKFDVKEFLLNKDKQPVKRSGIKLQPPRAVMHLKSLSKCYHLSFDTMEEYINEFISKDLYRWELTDVYTAIDILDRHAISTILRLAKI